jgi:hypothetical protein
MGIPASRVKEKRWLIGFHMRDFDRNGMAAFDAG